MPRILSYFFILSLFSFPLYVILLLRIQNEKTKTLVRPLSSKHDNDSFSRALLEMDEKNINVGRWSINSRNFSTTDRILPKQDFSTPIPCHEEYFSTPIPCHELTRNLPKTVLKPEHLQAQEFFDLSYNNDVYLDAFRYIHPAKDLCKGKNDSEKLIVLLVISDTLVSGHLFRDAIRATWGRHLKKYNRWCIRLGFIIGNSTNSSRMIDISLESHRYGDIIQGSFGDGYNHFTDKTMTAFRWAQQFCSNASLIMRVTHDTVVNIPLLTKWAELFDTQRKTRLYFGDTQSMAEQYKEGKYQFRSPVKWPTNKYPPFNTGTGYAISMDLAVELNALFCRTPIAFPDDIYIGALVDSLGATAQSTYHFQQTHSLGVSDFYRITKKNVIVHFVNWDSKLV
ncbi:unnamed protein product, partial [Owenia fusiformis]